MINQEVILLPLRDKDLPLMLQLIHSGIIREDGHVRRILTELGVDELLKFSRYDPSDIVITPDFKITFWNRHRGYNL